MSRNRVASWIDFVENALNKISRESPNVKNITTALVLAFIEKESAGDPNVYVPSSPNAKFAAGRKSKQSLSGRGVIMGGFQGSANWYNAYARAPGAPELENSLQYANRIRGNPQLQVEDFLRSMASREQRHYYRPDLMAILHARCGSGSCTRALISKLSPEQQAAIAMGLDVEGNTDDAIRFSKSWLQKSRGKRGLMYSYARGIYDKYIKWAQYLGEPDPRSKFITDWAEGEKISVPEYTIDPNNFQTLTGIPGDTFESSGSETVPFISGTFITPEEARKGIIAEVFHLTDWHLLQIDDPEQKKINYSKDTRDGGDIEAPIQSSIETNQSTIDQVNQSTIDQVSQGNRNLRSDLSTNTRQLFIQSMVEGEYYRRKYSTRSIAPITGPFNPYPVSGFPGLIMDPVRPVIAYVDSVTHNINVASGQGTTSVSMSFPRYWNEGDIYYWLGGNASEDPQSITRRFPRWFNRLVVATNNYTINDDGEVERFNSSLDDYYEFMLGSKCIDYQSNHALLNITDEIVKTAIAERKPGPFEVSPETLDINDYNDAIADTDSDGMFDPNTLAGRIFGNKKPSEDLSPKISIDEFNSERERYGVSEVELLKDFLGNDFEFIKDGNLVWHGPTFGSFQDEKGNIYLNQIQQAVVNYIRELEGRQLL